MIMEWEKNEGTSNFLLFKTKFGEWEKNGEEYIFSLPVYMPLLVWFRELLSIGGVVRVGWCMGSEKRWIEKWEKKE